MTKRTFKFGESGKLEEVMKPIGVSPEVQAHAVHQDTLETPLRHPVTGRVHESKSTYLRDCAVTGTRVVGNDWLGLERIRPNDDKVTDELIMDRIHKAEAIMRDPAKRRERNNLSMKMAEASREFMENGKINVRREH